MDLRRRARRRFAVAALALISLVATWAPLSPPARARTVHGPYQLAPGVKLWKIRYQSPHQVRVLRIDPTQATIDVVGGGDEFGSISRVSVQAVDNGAIAAINGDFGTFKGEPTHPNMIDAVLRTSGPHLGSTFSVATGGERAWAKRSELTLEATTPGGHVFKVWRLNAGDADHHRIVSWTVVGGDVEDPVNDMCAARLVPAGPYQWSDLAKSGVMRSYTVEEQPDPCVFAPATFDAGGDPGAVILQAPRDCTCAKRIKELDAGDAVDLAWSTKGRPNTTDLIGGQPQLVRAGKNVAPSTTHPGYFYNENPRTGVGITKGCTDTDLATKCYVYFITVDGRQQGWSKGMTLTRFAQEFLRQSPPAYFAFNLDGGGGTEMWVSTESGDYCQLHPPAGGCTVNKPSDGHERSAITTLQVLADADPGEPI
jgi:hypothetical protein